MWIDKREMSEWAYYYCRAKQGNNSMKKLITSPRWAYMYCFNIYDDLEVKNYIKNSTKWQENYNSFIDNSPGRKNREEEERKNEK